MKPYELFYFYEFNPADSDRRAWDSANVKYSERHIDFNIDQFKFYSIYFNNILIWRQL